MKEIYKKKKNVKKWVIENIDKALEDKYILKIVKQNGYKNTFKDGLRWVKEHLQRELRKKH